MKHTDFFRSIGAKLVGRNARQAWDGELPNGTRILVLWYDQRVEGDDEGVYLALQRVRGRHRGQGPIHRLQTLERFTVLHEPLLAVLAQAVDPKADPRTVKSLVNSTLYRVTEVRCGATHWTVRIRPMADVVDPPVCRVCGYREEECRCA